MTLAQAKVLLKRYGFDDSDPLEDWLNEGQEMVEDAHDWPFLLWRDNITWAAGTATKTWGTQTSFKPVSLRNLDEKRKILPVSLMWFEREIEDPTKQGSPLYYYLSKSFTSPNSSIELTVWPVPSVSFQASLVSQLRSLRTDQIADGDELNFPEPALHYPVVLAAAYTALMAENEEERAQTALAQFDNAVEQRWQRYSSTSLDEPEQVVDIMGYGDY